MADPENSLVTRRPRRSTAGNRMEAALAEMALDDVSKDLDDDKDFVNDKDEEDVFGSDFESTDEEAAQGEGEVGERVVEEEDEKARRAARSRVERATAAAHAKHKVTFNPQAESQGPSSKPKGKPKRRVSLGFAINAETGEIIMGENDESAGGKKRHSQRKHTILNTSATVKRMQKSEEKRAAATPKKIKIKTRSLTQDELISRALDNEEGNIVEHRDYLMLEEEKRKRARVVRATIDGPLLRWVSKGEEVKVQVASEPPPPVYQHSQWPGYTYGYRSYGQTAYSASASASTSTGMPPPSAGKATTTATPATTPSTSPYSSTTAQQQSSSPLPPAFSYTPYSPQVPAPYNPSQPPVPQLTERTEKVVKNYVVHELAQYEGAPKPPWTETMQAMFGDHARWDEMKVYVGKQRPLSRPRQMCLITGKQAQYLDPRTGVPYADLDAYKVLSRILKHEYVWSPGLGCYIGQEEKGDIDPDALQGDSDAMDVAA